MYIPESKTTKREEEEEDANVYIYIPRAERIYTLVLIIHELNGPPRTSSRIPHRARAR